MSIQPATTPGARPTEVYQRGPNLLIRFIWWLFIGWWASGIAVTIAWLVVANFTPFGYAFTNHIIWFFAGVVWTTFLRPARAPAVGPVPAQLALAPSA